MRWKTGIFGLMVILSLNLCPFFSAYASDIGTTEDPTYAMNYLGELSAKANIPESDLVATLAGTNSIYTGVNWTNPDGTVALKNQLSPNLLSYKRNVIYGKSWEELTSSEQEEYINEENYYATNFNSSLDAYGLGDARDRYYASGGADFSWTSEEENILGKIKSVYDDWNTGKDVLISNVLDLFKDDAEEDFKNYLGTQNFKELDLSNEDGYTSNIPNPLYVNKGASFEWLTENPSNPEATWKPKCIASAPVYFVVYYYESARYRYLLCSRESFTYGFYVNSSTYPSLNKTASLATYDGKDYYFGGTGVQGGPFISGIALSGATTFNNNSLLARLILFNDQVNGIGKIEPGIDGYPQDIQAEGNVKSYFPSGGITSDTSWTSYLEEISEDTDDIVTILKRILTEVKLLDHTSESLTTLENLVSGLEVGTSDLSNLESLLGRFQFYGNGELKVHDLGLYDSLTDIGNDISQILAQLVAWPKGDAVDAPDLIGDFNFPQLKTKAGQLVENVSDLAPFGGLLLLSEMVGILSQTGNIQKPDFHVPFKFMPGEEFEVVIDLSWLDDGRVYINFLCILSLILCLLNVTIRIIELEAAS